MGEAAWISLGLAAALGAAGVTIFARLGLGGVDATLATALRSVVMTGALLAVTFGNGSLGLLLRGESGFDARAWRFVLLAGLCGAASWLAYFGALRVGPAGPVAALDRLSLPLVFALGVFALGERPGAGGWLGLGLILSGTWLVVSDALARGA